MDDCVAAARFLVEPRLGGPGRMAIKGGSAGGFTTLAALTPAARSSRPASATTGSPTSRCIHHDRHKFESRYDEGLLGPVPGAAHVFRERSPIHAFDRVVAPMLITQGLDDKVVPPSQLDAMVAALHGRGIPHAAITFEGEGHGYRRADSRRRVYAAELSFLGQVFGFTPADAIEPIAIEHLAPTA